MTKSKLNKQFNNRIELRDRVNSVLGNLLKHPVERVSLSTLYEEAAIRGLDKSMVSSGLEDLFNLGTYYIDNNGLIKRG